MPPTWRRSSSGRRPPWCSTRARKVVAIEPRRPAQLRLHARRGARPDFHRPLQRRGRGPAGAGRARAGIHPRTPLEMRQSCQDGSSRNVEAHCYPLQLDNKSGAGRGGARRDRAPQGRDAAAARNTSSSITSPTTTSSPGSPTDCYLPAHLPGAIEEAQEHRHRARGAVPRPRPLQARQRLART